jgi:hypothetical protein
MGPQFFSSRSSSTRALALVRSSTVTALRDVDVVAILLREPKAGCWAKACAEALRRAYSATVDNFMAAIRGAESV